jgi:hypothetical protein
MNGFYYTPGWGALATTTVALIAVLVNIYTNRRTLRASATHFETSQKRAQNALDTSIEQFQQLREDTRLDKLRIEIIGLVNALAERRTRLDIAVSRIHDTLDKLDLSEFRPPDTAGLDRADHAMRGAMAEEFWDVYARVSAHAFAIRMLTTDASILRQLNDIQEAVAMERRLYEFDVMGGKIHKRNEDDVAQENVLDDRLRAASTALVSYSLTNLRTRQHSPPSPSEDEDHEGN